MTKEKIKIPKDLKLEIGSETEAMWTQVKRAATQAIKNCENEIMVQTELLKIAEEKIQIEKDLVADGSKKGKKAPIGVG